MNTLDAIKQRRSIRRFKNELVSEEVIKNIIEHARFSPSWKNTQVTRYYILEDKNKIKQIASNATLGFTYNIDTLENANQVAVLTAIKGRSGVERDGSYSTDKDASWLMFDVGVASQSFCLSAYELGVGTVIMGYFSAEKVKEILGIADNEEVVVLIPFGYALENPESPKRKTVDELLKFIK